MNIRNKVFTFQKVSISDDCNLFEVITQDGNRIATSAFEGVASTICIDLNAVLLSHLSAGPDDVVINSQWR